MFFGKYIFGFVFGDNWATAGLYAQILAPWMYSKFILSPISVVPIIVNKIKVFFVYSLILNLIIPACFYFMGNLYQNFEFILFVTSSIVFIYGFVLILWIRRITMKKSINF